MAVPHVGSFKKAAAAWGAKGFNGGWAVSKRNQRRAMPWQPVLGLKTGQFPEH